MDEEQQTQEEILPNTVRIQTTIPIETYKKIKEKNLRYTDLIRVGLRTELNLAKDEEERRQINYMLEKQQKAIAFLNGRIQELNLQLLDHERKTDVKV